MDPGRRTTVCRLSSASSLQFNLGADFFEFGLDLLSFFLAHGFLNRLRGAVHEGLGFFEAEGRELADDLDDLQLVRAGVGENDVEVGLLLGGGSGAGGRSGSGGSGDRSGGNAELLLKRLDELGGSSRVMPETRSSTCCTFGDNDAAL